MQVFPRAFSGRYAGRLGDGGSMATTPSLRKAHFGRIDRRSDGRNACEGATVIDILSPKPRNGVQARIIDVGESSLKLSLPFFLSPGALVRIHMTDSIAYGEARYCSAEGAEYYVGIKVEEVAPKSA
jgi:hypothetical protein